MDLLIAWPVHDERTLGDLVESLQGMPEDDQTKVWDLIDQWTSSADEGAKANLRECIRHFALTRRGHNRRLGAATRDRARETHDRLQSLDPVIRHSWLFADQWVQESTDELQDGDLDFHKHEERIDRLRREAMTEVWAESGFDGIRTLLSGSGAAGIIGRYAAICITSDMQQVDFIRRCLSLTGDLQNNAEWCIRGFLLAMEEDSHGRIVRAVADGLAAAQQTRLFACAPFQASTWRLLEEYSKDIRIAYWKDVTPSWGRHTPAELTEIIDRLLEAKRPRVAFHVVRMNFKDIETSRLKRLLRDVTTVNIEPPGHFKLHRYDISKALDSLDGRTGVTRDEMAQLEFLFIDALDDSEHGIPNLESQIAESPAIFVQAVALAYKRSDASEDPPEWRVEDPNQKTAVAMAAHRLLDQVRKIPGTDENGCVNAAALGAWLADVRRLCKEHARAAIGDHCLGQLLARAPADKDGMWPCEGVCQALDEIASPEIAKGFYIGVYNSRRAVWRGKVANRSASSQPSIVLVPSACISAIPMSETCSKTLPRLTSVRQIGRTPEPQWRRDLSTDTQVWAHEHGIFDQEPEDSMPLDHVNHQGRR